MKNSWKRVAAGALSLAMVVGMIPANVGGFLTGGKVIVASATEALTDVSGSTKQSDSSDSMEYHASPFSNCSDYSGLHSFSVNGILDNEPILTTYRNHGYTTAMQVDSGWKTAIPNDNTQFVYGKVYTVDGVQIRLFADFIEEGKAVAIKYELHNTTNEKKTVKFGSCGDTQIGNNDSALVKFTGNSIIMRDNNHNSSTYGAYFKLSPGDSNFTTKWIGGFGGTYQNIFNNSEETSYSGDSGIAWSWEVELDAGETITKTADLSITSSIDISDKNVTVDLVNSILKMKIDYEDKYKLKQTLHYSIDDGEDLNGGILDTGSSMYNTFEEDVNVSGYNWQPNTEHTIKIWLTNDEGVTSETLTYKVYWTDSVSDTDEVSTVKFITDSGDLFADVQGKNGTEIVLPTYDVPDDYKLCWALNKEGVGELYPAGSSYTIDGDVTLYSVLKKEFNVTFDSNGGSPEKYSVGVYDGNTVNAPETAPTKDGYTFICWSADGETAFDFNTPVTENITLTAVWKNYAVVTIPDGAVIAGQEPADVYNLVAGNTYTIYSQETLTPSDKTGLKIVTSTDEEYNGTTYNYVYTVTFANTITNGTEIDFAHKHATKAFSIDEDHPDTDKVWVYCEGEPSVKAECIAQLNSKGAYYDDEEGIDIYYFGDVPTENDVSLSEHFGATAAIKKDGFYFTEKGDESGRRVSAKNMKIGKTYVINATIAVTIDNKISNFNITKEFKYAARPLTECDIFYTVDGGDEIAVDKSTWDIENNTYNVYDVAVYDGKEHEITIIVKNPETGEIVKSESEYVRYTNIENDEHFADKATEADWYWTGFSAPEKVGEDNNNYIGSFSVSWTIAKADAVVTADAKDNIVYDGEALNESDFEFDDKQEVLKSTDAEITIKNNANGEDIINAKNDYTAHIVITSKNYNDIVLDVPVAVKKREVKVTPAEAQSMIYGDEKAPVISVTAETAVDENGDGVWDTLTGVLPADVETVDFAPTIDIANFDYNSYINNAGTYTYEVSTFELENYTAVLESTSIFTIKPKELTAGMFKVDDVDYTFDGDKKYAPEYDYDDGRFKDRNRTKKLTNNDFTVGGTDHAVLPGTYTIEFSGQGNYTGFVSYDWKIKPIQTYAVSVSVEKKTYDGKAVVPSSYIYETADENKTPLNIKGAKTTYTYYEYDGTSGITEEYVKSLTALSNAPKNAGTYIVEASTTAKGYSFAKVYTTFTISQREIAITPNVSGKSFGDFDPDFSDFSYDESAVIAGDKVSFTGEYGLENYDGSVGTYNYTLGTVEVDNDNYCLSIGGEFKVNAQELTDANIIVFRDCTVGDDNWFYPGDCVRVVAVVNGEEIELTRPVFDDDTGEYINTDYEFISATKTKNIGGFSVQVKGVGNYTGYAEAIVNIYSDQYTVNVISGTLDNGEAVSAYREKDIVVAKADDAPEGYKFGYWTRNGVTASYNPTYTFYMPNGNVELEAFYVENADDIERYGNAAIESVTLDKENQKIAVVSLLNVPEDCTILKAGVVATSDSDKAANLTIDTSDYNTLYDTEITAHNYRYTLTIKNAMALKTWYVKGYLEYEDANGNVKTVYSDMTKVNLDGYETVEEEKIVGTAIMEDVIKDTANNVLKFVSLSSVPADCTIVKSGVVATSNATKAENLTIDNSDYDNLFNTGITQHNFRYTLSIKNDAAKKTWYVRPYLVYTDASGKEFTVYGDLSTGTLN